MSNKSCMVPYPASGVGVVVKSGFGVLVKGGIQISGTVAVSGTLML